MTAVKNSISSCHLYLKTNPGDNNLSLSYNNKEQVAPNVDAQIMIPPIKESSNNIRIVPAINSNVKILQNTKA
jgi:hypothetical protein